MAPLPNLVAIEFPGVLRDPTDPTRVLNALGGEKSVGAYIATPPSPSVPRLILNLRPSNEVSQSNIKADAPRDTGNLFLIRVSPTSSSSANPPTLCDVTTVVVGRVVAVTEFCSLADFQYHPSASTVRAYALPSSSGAPVQRPAHMAYDRSAVAERILHALKNKPARGLTLEQCIDRLRPMQFARPAPDRGTLNYWYRQYRFPLPEGHEVEHPGPLVFIPGQPLGNDRRSQPDRLRRLPHRVSYAIDAVPRDAPPTRTVARGRAAFTKLVSLLRLLFQQRPVWLRRALLFGVPAELRANFKKAIACVAYSFQGSGAFSQACVKYGHDPRKDPNSRKYQVLEVRCSHPLLEAVRVVREEQGYGNEQDATEDNETLENQKAGLACITSDLFKMPREFILDDVPMKRNNFFQICDIKVDEINTVIAEQPMTRTYDSKFGFFSEESMAAVMRAIKKSLFLKSKKVLGEERSRQIFKSDARAMKKLQCGKRGRLQLRDVIKAEISATKRIARPVSKKRAVEHTQDQSQEDNLVVEESLEEPSTIDEEIDIDEEYYENIDIEGQYGNSASVDVDADAEAEADNDIETVNVAETDDEAEVEAEANDANGPEDGDENGEDASIESDDDADRDDGLDYAEELTGFEIYDSDDIDDVGGYGFGDDNDDDIDDDDDDDNDNIV